MLSHTSKLLLTTHSPECFLSLLFLDLLEFEVLWYFVDFLGLTIEATVVVTDAGLFEVGGVGLEVVELGVHQLLISKILCIRIFQIVVSQHNLILKVVQSCSLIVWLTIVGVRS